MKNIVVFVGLALALVVACAPTQASDIAVIVNAETGISDMSKKDVKKLFLGKSKKLPNGSRAVIVRLKASGSDFNKGVLGASDSKVKSTWSKLIFSGRAKAPVELDSIDAVIDYILSNPNAVGFVNTNDLPTGITTVFTAE